METTIDYRKINKHINNLKDSATVLGESGRDIPAIVRNIVRIKASVKMLELNISDILEITENDKNS